MSQTLSKPKTKTQKMKTTNPTTTVQAQPENGVIKYKGRYVRRLGNYEGEPRIYRIIRFRFNGSPRTIRNNVTLTEAQNHCSREDTSSHSTGNGAWFDGYEYMKGCKPRD